MSARCRAILAWLILWALAPLSASDAAPNLYTAGNTFTSNSHYVSTTVFSWFDAQGGQVSGPWRPIEGRANWTGTASFWEGQIKQMMAANIDVMQVTLMPLDHTEQRGNLFKAMSNLRAQGYNVPKVTPFLDTSITAYYGWTNPAPGRNQSIDLATTAGKDAFVDQYTQFYRQYYSVNTDAHADSYLTQLDGRVVMDAWHFFDNSIDPVTHETSLTATEMQTRLTGSLGSHALFANMANKTNKGIYMINSSLGTPLSFANEILPQFESTQYFHRLATTAAVKPGYWDQNVRNPGSILKRNGGTGYTGAWTSVQDARSGGLKHVNVESWNEYDEGSGIYAANPTPYTANRNRNTDTWSATNDPYQYIKTTAMGAAAFNDTDGRDAAILWNNLPTTMKAGETITAQVILQNTGDMSWTGAAGFKFSQCDTDATRFGGRTLISDTANEIPTYGGIFRGRPITFDVQLTAPTTTGIYATTWQMLQENQAWFGDQLSLSITVVPEPSALVLLGIAFLGLCRPFCRGRNRMR